MLRMSIKKRVALEKICQKSPEPYGSGLFLFFRGSLSNAGISTIFCFFGEKPVLRSNHRPHPERRA